MHIETQIKEKLTKKMKHKNQPHVFLKHFQFLFLFLSSWRKSTYPTVTGIDSIARYLKKKSVNALQLYGVHTVLTNSICVAKDLQQLQYIRIKSH